MLTSLLLILAAHNPAPTPDPRLTAAQNLIGRALILRAFPATSDLHYDTQGHLTTKTQQTDWTLAGMDVLTVTQPTPTTLQLEGLRAAIRFNPDTRTFDRHPQKSEPIHLTLDLGSKAEPATPAALTQTLAAIFSTGIDPALQHSTPPFWQHYFDPTLTWSGDPELENRVDPKPADPKTPGFKPPEVNGFVTVALSPDKDAACLDHITEVSSSFTFIVDTKGHIRRMTLAKPFGYGFDVHLFYAAKAYPFRPATIDGVPVPATFTQKLDLKLDCQAKPAQTRVP